MADDGPVRIAGEGRVGRVRHHRVELGRRCCPVRTDDRFGDLIPSPHIGAMRGLAVSRSDRLLPAALSRRRPLYPLDAPDPAAAERWLARAVHKPEKLTLYTAITFPFTSTVAQVFTSSLRQLGIEVEVTGFDLQTLLEKVATPGEPWDVAWLPSGAPYPDPAAVLVPIAIDPALASSHVYGPIRFTLVALGVIAYLFGVSFFTQFHEPPAPRSIRGLSSAQAGPAERWRRRERVYWMLVAMSLLIPTVLIAWVNFDTMGSPARVVARTCSAESLESLAF